MASRLIPFGAALVFGLLPYLPSAWAHEGHDHGPPPPAPAGQVLAPRASAESADFELVGSLQDGRLRLYLDDFPTNRPIEDATIEVAAGSFRAGATHLGEGVYELAAGPLGAPGRHELIFTVLTPTVADLLIASLEVPDEPRQAGQAGTPSQAWYASVPLLQGAVVVLALCVLVLLAWRDRRPGRINGLLVAALLAAAWADAGRLGTAEAHGQPDPTPGASERAASRLPDGSLFVPKPVQRLLGLRTEPAVAGEWPDSFTLTGHVLPDPNASALIQAPLPGRIELPEAGLPLLGERVQRGQVLAYLVPILDAVDRTSLRAELAELTGRIRILARDLQRLRQLGPNAPRQELEQTETEHESLLARRDAIADSFAERLPLAAPVAGVLALRSVSPGQIVSSGETLFTVVDPQRLWVEALLYDTDHASHFVSASARTADGRELRLTPLGSGYELRGHALPIQFRIESEPAGPAEPYLAVRQPLSVTAQMNHHSRGLRIPANAIQRGPDGRDRLWLHVRPEQFRSVAVEVRDLGSGYAVVTQGISAGDRVVSQGAALLEQVR